MQIAVHSLLLLASIILVVVGALGRKWLSRRFSKPQQLQLTIVAVAAVLCIVNMVPYFVSSATPDTVAVFVTSALGVALAMRAYNLRIPTTRSPVPRRIVAIGAHPDDLELACGGTLAKLAD